MGSPKPALCNCESRAISERSLAMEAAGSSVVVRDVVCRFGDKTALNQVELTIAPGEIHALLGPNGAGKTTLIRALCGLVTPQLGTVFTSGRVGLVPSGDRSFYLRISALENLIFFARLHGLRLRQARIRAREALDAVGLGDVANRPVGRCSHGMQKRLAVARAVLVSPQVLLVDEATHDLDPEGARRVRDLVSRLADDGTAVLWTTQRVDEVPDFAHSTTMLVQGSVVFSGSPAELAARAASDRYLIQVRAIATGGPPLLAAVQLATGPAAAILPTNDAGYFLLVPREVSGLGATVARLVAGGFEVIGCRQAHSEMEAAFLVLTGAAA
jgi:ABC-2 type transport system ATP-binding protein